MGAAASLLLMGLVLESIGHVVHKGRGVGSRVGEAELEPYPCEPLMTSGALMAQKAEKPPGIKEHGLLALACQVGAQWLPGGNSAK